MNNFVSTIEYLTFGQTLEAATGPSFKYSIMRWQNPQIRLPGSLNPFCGLLFYLGISLSTLSDQALLETVINLLNWRPKIDLNKNEMGPSALGRSLMLVHCHRPHFTHGVHAA